MDTIAKAPDRPAREAQDGLPMPTRIWAAMGVGVGIVMAVLDSSIANVGLPAIARDLAVSPASSIWVVNAYQLVIVSSLLPLAALGDILGYRRIFQSGLVIFSLASLACALSHSLPGLVIARIAQGVGAAGIMSVNTALLRFIYPRRIIGRGIAINAMIVATSSALGPTVASAILAVAAWPWLFAVNVPIGAAGVLLAALTLPRNEPSGHRFDVVSAVMSAAAFALLIIGIEALGHDEGRARVFFPLLASVAIGFFLVRRQLSQTAPLLPVDLLRNRAFGMAVVTSICSFMSQGLSYVSLPFFLEGALGMSQVQTGLLMTPWPLTTAIAAPLSGRLADRFPAGLLGGIGLSLMAAGLFSLVLLPAHPGMADIVWRMSLCGFGFVLFQTPNNRAMILSSPKARSGAASGMLGTARVLGQTIGAALVAVLFGLFGANGTRISLGAAACVAAAAAAVSLSRLALASPRS